MAKILLTPEELSERWKLPLSTLDQWRWYGKGPQHLKMGKRIRYPLENIEKFEEQSLRSNTSSTQKNLCPNIKLSN
jgi:predicted site-specific integrase-resolvase